MTTGTITTNLLLPERVPTGADQWLRFGLDAAAALALVFLAWLLARSAVLAVERKGLLSRRFRDVVLGGLRWLMIVVAILVILARLGVNINAILAALSTLAVMVAIGFVAVWSILSNILSSLLIVLFKTFGIGDEIEVIDAVGGEGLRGEVVSMNLFYTVIAERREQEDGSVKRCMVHVPNNTFFQKAIRHWY